MMRYFVSFTIFTLLLLVVVPFSILESNAIFTPVLPIHIVDEAPTVTEFRKFSQNSLLKDYNPVSLVRENGERIDSYYFYDNSKNGRIIAYIEDSTDERLEFYQPFNSDFITWFFETADGKSYFIFGERNGNSLWSMSAQAPMPILSWIPRKGSGFLSMPISSMYNFHITFSLSTVS